MHIQTKIYKPSTGLNNNCSTDKVLPYYIKVFLLIVVQWLHFGCLGCSHVKLVTDIFFIHNDPFRRKQKKKDMYISLH